MLSEDPTDFRASEPPLRPIPPIPNNTLPPVDGVDWSLIASCDPELISESNDIDTLTSVIQTFVKAKFTQTEAQLMPNPLTSKLFHLLQIGIQYLLDCQDQLQSDISSYKKTIQAAKTKIHSLMEAIKRSKEANLKKERFIESTEKCVICGRRFKNITYLDSHVQRRHSALVPAWRSLRSGELQFMDDITDQIELLRKEIARTNRELLKYATDENKSKHVSHIVSHSNETQQLMNELLKKQEQLFEQTKIQDEKQQNFRREIRNQLDDAVYALQESCSKHAKQMELENQQKLSNENVEMNQNIINENEIENMNKNEKNINKRQRVRFEEIPPPPFLKLNKNDSSEEPIKLQTNENININAPKYNINKFDNNLNETDNNVNKTDKININNNVDKANDKINNNNNVNKTDKIINNNKDSDIIVSEALKNEMRHNQILTLLDDSDSSEEANKPTKQMPNESIKNENVTNDNMNEIDTVVQSAYKLYDHQIELDNFHDKELELKDEIVNNVNEKYAKLKKQRSVPISSTYVKKKLQQNTEEYNIANEKLRKYISTKVPNENNIRNELFKEKQIHFPQITETLTSTQTNSNINNNKNEINEISSKRIPFNQRFKNAKPFDDEVEIVDMFSSEINSSESIAFSDDPFLYVRNKKKQQEKSLKIEEIVNNENENENENKIVPLELNENENAMKFDEFATESDEEEENVKVSTIISFATDSKEIEISDEEDNEI
ncbi:Zinc finger, C2H2 type family protein [Histomonas meleagridis]|uniref:zinc finger protein, C2H2 type family protein n=1 Tax=Histomonas meleagridis TaxID=135588 RepID=UPI00355A5B7B|nr:Zinc finger, C2H2 type family protein [Histomonas meleagridis]KAH0802901.1 zinc finger protein, C2H2 type family protein [Histomonas meleagridis]